MLFKKQLAAYVASILFLIVMFFIANSVKQNTAVVAFPVNLTDAIIIENHLPPVQSFKKFAYRNLSAKDRKEVDCLAKNMYHEAKGEPRDGILAVGMVTMNRLYSQKFPKTVCEIVYQRTGNVYQFSWVPKKNHLTIKHDELYNRILEKAILIYTNYHIMTDMTRGALFFHADYVRPNWGNLKKTTQIGRHIFYTIEQRF